MDARFLHALHASPDDPLGWLVLADWLEEQGQPERAELHQVRQRLLTLEDDPARAELESRLLALLGRGVRPCVPAVTNSLGQEFALIPPGKFLMGSPRDEEGRWVDEGPRHAVTITRAFYLGAHPVTQQQYQRVTGENPSDQRPGRGLPSTDQMPVENISFNDALTFCDALNRLPEEAAAGRSYTLPTEAQWEYACRAGVCTSPFHFGPATTADLANVIIPRDEEGDPLHPGRPTEVGTYPPNAFGLYDMHGNVWEWCRDWYAERAYRGKPRANPTGPRTGLRRVLRGGDWDSIARLARSACRGHNEVDARHNYNGFRLVLIPRPAR